MSRRFFWINNYKGTGEEEPAGDVEIVDISTSVGTNASSNSLTGVPAGALLVLTFALELSQSDATTLTSTPSLTWAKRVEASSGESSNAEIWTAVFTAGGNITVNSTWPTGWATENVSAVLYAVVNQESTLSGNSATSTGQSSPSRTITTTRANSIVFCATADWNAVNGSSRTYRETATESYYRFSSGVFTGYHYYKVFPSTGTYTMGLTAPTGMQASTAVLEIRSNE